MQETRVQSLGGEDPPEKGMATHSRILAWRIPWTEEPVGHNPWGRKRVGWIEVTEQAYKVTELACGRAGNQVSRIPNIAP